MMHHHIHETDDAELVARVLCGERETFGPLLLRHYASVDRLCRRLLGRTPEAQDVTQEAALQAFLRLSELNTPARFGAWLHAIAANLARMELRRRRMLSLDSLPDSAPMVVLWTAAPHTPEDVQAARELHDTIVAALSELSALNREVVIGFYLDGYSYAELAELLGVPVSTVKGRLFKGRRQLQGRLAPTARAALTVNHTNTNRKEHAMSQSDPLEVEVESIVKSRIHGTNVVVLRTKDHAVVLPIWIGDFEANAIAAILQQRTSQRPMTHDLSLQMLAALGGQVERVLISRLDDKVFYAEIELTLGGQQQRVDARPSDALALAVRAGAPILVAREVLETAGAPSIDEWTQQHTPEIAGKGPLARTESIEQTWKLELIGGLGTDNQRAIAVAEFTSADWPGPHYQRDLAWDGQDMLAIQLPAGQERAPWLIVPPDFWERQTTTIVGAQE